MRKKLISKTYLRDVIDYNFTFYKREDLDYYVSVKHILKTDPPFVVESNNEKISLIDDGYYIVEIIPKNEYYSIRTYVDQNKKILGHYIDISRGNGMEKDELIPYYDDLYLDIGYQNGKVELIDENELEEAYRDGNITKEEYDLAYTTANKLIDELKNGTNKYMNIDINEYLNI